MCDDSLKTSHAQMIFYFGVLAGDVGFGSLADVYVDFITYRMICLHSKTINMPSEILHRQSDGVIILRAVPMILNI